jgi:hypothetical protein
MLPWTIPFIIFITMLVACGSQNTAQPGNTAPVNALSAPKPKVAAGVQASPQTIVTRPSAATASPEDKEQDDPDASSKQEPDIAPISEDK